MKPRFKAMMALMSLALLLTLHGCGQAPFSKTEIKQLVAPIALYPDSLLSQMLMASTYPHEVVEAASFVKKNPNLKGKALEDSLVRKAWDESVKSLTAVPQVLIMLDKKLDLTQKLGDAFLAQQKEVLDAVQSLRIMAREAGNLESSKELEVIPQQEGDSSYITLEPVYPEVVYVPSYDPNTIYGTWPYPSDPPYEYYPPDYVARQGLYFGAGLATGYALWGNFNWRERRVGIDVDPYNRFNRTNITDGRWRHRVEHRKGVQYRDLATQQRFGKGPLQGADAREAFRGRAEQGRAELRRASNVHSGQVQRISQFPHQGFEQRNRGQNLSDQQSFRFKQPNRTQAFEGIDRGREIRNFSQRGRTSRPSSISRGNYGGGSRGAGGRAGGGSRGGGGRRR